MFKLEPKSRHFISLRHQAQEDKTYEVLPTLSTPDSILSTTPHLVMLISIGDRELSYPCSVSCGLDMKCPFAEVLTTPNSRLDMLEPSISRPASGLDFVQDTGCFLPFLFLFYFFFIKLLSNTLVTENTASALHGSALALM